MADPADLKRRLTMTLAPGLVAFSMGQTVLFAVAGPAFREVGLSESQLGQIISAAAVIFVFSSAIWGRIADRWGRRPTVIFGLWCYGLISLAFAAVLQLGMAHLLTAGSVFLTLLGLRLLYAGFGGGIQPASVALMADVSSREERASSVALVGAAFGIGMVLGPAAAALLVGFGILVPLYVIAGLGLLAALLATFRLPKVAPIVSEDQGSAEARGLIPLLIGALLVFLAISSMQQTLAFHVQDLLGTDMQDTARLTGFCFMAIAIATLAMQGGVIQVLKPSPRVLLLAGLPIGFVGFLVYAGATSYPGVLLAASLIGIGFGLVNPGLSAAASLRTGVDAQGRTAGLMQAMMSAGYVFGPVTATTLYEIDGQYAVLLALTAIGLAILIIGGWLMTLRAPATTAGEAL